MSLVESALQRREGAAWSAEEAELSDGGDDGGRT